MQHVKEYGQSAPSVKSEAVMLRQRGHQTHRANVRVGKDRVHVSGDFDTIMGWVRLALAEMEAA